jgi:YVTN family beta-propeller protein
MAKRTDSCMLGLMSMARFGRTIVFVFALWLFGGGWADAKAPLDYVVYISNERSGDVTALDGVTFMPIATWPVGKRPRGLHLSPDGQTLYVAVSGSPRLGPGADPERARNAKADKSADGIAAIDTQTGVVRRKLDVGSDPEEFALSADGRTVYASNEDEARATAWDITTGKKIFTAIVSEEPEGVALHPTRAEVYVTCEALGDVFILDATTGAVRSSVRVGGRPRSVAFARDGALACVPVEGKAEVAIIDTASQRLVSTIAVRSPGALPMGAVMAHDGRELFVSNGRGNTVAVIDVERREVVATIPVGERAWGIGLSPDGKKLFTANGGSNDVSVVDVASRKEIKRVPVGDGPWGVAIGVGSRESARR